MSNQTQPSTSTAEPAVHPDHDRGLEFDVRTLMARRSALGLLSGAGLLALVGCSDGSSGSTARPPGPRRPRHSVGDEQRDGSATASATAVDTVVPDETAGPYPGDGSNGADVLDDSGIVRQDITSSFGTSTTTAAGVPLTLNLTVLDSSSGYAALAGVAVYAWHADAQGRYSMYSQGVENENYLRGVQPTDDAGHGELHHGLPGLLRRAVAAHPLRGLPQHRRGDERRADRQDEPDRPARRPPATPSYADGATYASSASNLARTSLTRDMVFGDDGGIHQLATVTGDASCRLRRQPHHRDLRRARGRRGGGVPAR